MYIHMYIYIYVGCLVKWGPWFLDGRPAGNDPVCSGCFVACLQPCSGIVGMLACVKSFFPSQMQKCLERWGPIPGVAAKCWHIRYCNFRGPGSGRASTSDSSVWGFSIQPEDAWIALDRSTYCNCDMCDRGLARSADVAAAAEWSFSKMGLLLLLFEMTLPSCHHFNQEIC